MEEKFIPQCWSYGIYDTEADNYRYLFTCKNNDVARRQFIAYAVGSNDLFNETLELHKLDKIGSYAGHIETDFSVLMDYEDIEPSVQEYREKTNKMINK